jgi:hypothetical protein
MKIAHLILTHKNPEQLQRLLHALEHPAFDFYLHIDGKSDAAPFEPLAKKKNVFLIRQRAKVYWAGYGTIQATLNGFEEILPKGYDYINVISAQDFPLQSPTAIYQYLLDRFGKEFITCESIEDQWKEAAHRVKRYHLINWRIPGKFRLQMLLNKLLPERKFPLDYTIVGRANWFTITSAAATYILQFLKENPRIPRFFKYCWGADEFIFATLLYNSPFKEKILDNLVYVDWTGQTKGHPRVLGTEDLEPLTRSGKLFGRKFDMDSSPAIFTLLEDWIGQGSTGQGSTGTETRPPAGS